jgi:hypothetical protein
LSFVQMDQVFLGLVMEEWARKTHDLLRTD